MKKRSKADRKQDSGTIILKTRVCLKNLPSNATTSSLQTFLKSRILTLNVTDTKVLPSRQMAFVGLSTEKEADDVIHQYNRAYFGTSRLTVEHAVAPARKGNENQDTTARKKISEAAIQLENKSEKESLIKHENAEKADRRKQEFLAVMGAKVEAQPGKAWANDDGDIGMDSMQLNKPSLENAERSDDSDSDTDTDSDDESSSNSSSSDDHDNSDPIKRFVVPDKNDDVAFLKSRTLQVDDLDDPKDDTGHTTANPLVTKNSDQSDDSSTSSSSSNASTSSSESSSDNEGKGAVQSSCHLFKEGVTVDTSQVLDSRRLFLRNLPFTTSTDDLTLLFAAYSPEEVHLPVDDQNINKGFGFVTLTSDILAQRALEELDGTDFQGRLLHILPAKRNQRQTSFTFATEEPELKYKDKQAIEKRQNAHNTTGWSASYLRGDAVIDTLAERLGLRKSVVLNVKDDMNSGDAAVRLALGETAIIEENRNYFAEHGIDMDALVSVHRMDEASQRKTPESHAKSRSNTRILVKNLPADTTEAELLKMFGSVGTTPVRILLPPSRTIAVVEYGHMNEAKNAFKRLAYKRFRSVPLYLEWAPLADGGNCSTASSKEAATSLLSPNVDVVQVDEGEADDDATGPIPTVFIKNLSFATSEQQLRDFLSSFVDDIRAVRLPKKLVPINRLQSGGIPEASVKELSMGYGFVEFGSSESVNTVIKTLQGVILDGHALEMIRSKAKQEAASTSSSNKASAKLMVRNIPFQATRKELLQLFGSFGQLKKVRLPKKFAGGHRGFCFIEYLTSKEAAAAMNALSRTHLYGRRLVIEWASGDDDQPDDLHHLREKAKRDVEHDSGRDNKKIRFG
jgi:multiple RNA-binding domain-containing protein 1